MFGCDLLRPMAGLVGEVYGFTKRLSGLQNRSGILIWHRIDATKALSTLSRLKKSGHLGPKYSFLRSSQC